ncbi:hypothetical protein [Pedobacter sp. L105]|uniref:hypothetical protein n=1 Tax=Pedobacter sp. L105 TaxID=1641871 RepID=UPI00131DD94E|nr:hypothetical protein [Pedobacter sp. L105]
MNFKPYKNCLNLSPVKVMTLLALLFSGGSSLAQQGIRAKKNIGFVYPVSSNGTTAPKDTNNFSLNLIAGVSASERGMSFAGLSTIVHHDASGMQITGFSNHIGENANGVLVAGFLNTYQGGKGTGIAGFANLSARSVGAQIAGFLNKEGDVHSLQIAGFMNLCRDLQGIQLSAFMNKAKKSNGTQIGFINIADSAGTQIGFINIAKNAEKSLALTIDENQTTLITFRSGGKLIYGILGLGYNINNKRSKYAYEAGLGAHILKIRSFGLNTELVTSNLEGFKHNENYFKSTFRLIPAFRISPSLELFGGPSINYITTDSEEGRNMTKTYISSWSRNNGQNFCGFYMGYTAGIQLYF